jgi:thymidylate synthase
MKPYLDLLNRVLTTGEYTENRTGVRTLMIPGAMMTFDLREGFPAVTTKKLAFKAVVGELCAFLRASKSAADFRALGCNVWDQNANENKQWLANPFRKGTDDLGPVYGAQWREWPAYRLLEGDDLGTSKYQKTIEDGWQLVDETGAGRIGLHERLQLLMYKKIDQLGDCIRLIIDNPDSRRILFHGWNPAVLDEIALAACHLLYQFMPNRNTGLLHMNLYQRSCDNFLGTPFNIAEAATLLSLVARLTGYTPGLLNIMQGDSHIYENHVEQVKEQLTRTPLASPTLKINERIPFKTSADDAVAWLAKVEPSDFTLENYQHLPPIHAPMAL